MLEGKTLDLVAQVPHVNTTNGALLAYAPTARKLYCTYWDRDSLDIVDAEADTVIGGLHLAGQPYSPQVDGRECFVYVCRITDLMVTAIDVAGDTVVADLALPSLGSRTASSPASGKVYVSILSKLAVFVDSATAILEPTGSGLGVPWGSNATVVRRGTALTLSERTQVIDVSGRLRATLQPGEQVLTDLPAGVYFVRAVSSGWKRRIVVLR